ncbi:amino acid permease, partial [Mycoplasma nasistruthionis]
MEKQFTEKSFTFFIINFVVGVGFITTISTVVKMSYWGYLVLILSAFCVFGIALVFSRLANTYNDHYGGSYSFARHLDDDVANQAEVKSKNVFLRNLVFFVGWNQFIQTPILSAVAPLFLAEVAKTALKAFGINEVNTLNYSLITWIINIVSIGFFILIILISTIGLKTNQVVLYISSAAKWIMLTIAMVIMLIAVFKNSQTTNVDNKIETTKITSTLIFGNILLFMYAFGGIEDAAAMVKDVKFKSFNKVLLYAFAFIFVFYLVFFSLYLFLPKSNGIDSSNISNIYQYGLGGYGIVIFVIGFLL